jgi:uncharacterized protein (DUF697 family)
MKENGEKEIGGEEGAHLERLKVKRERKRLYDPPDQTLREEAPLPRGNKAIPALIENYEGRAISLVKDHVMFSMALGTLPLPLADMIAVTGIQLRLLNQLTQVYGVSYSRDKGKSVIASIIGGIGSFSLTGVFASFAKVVPVAGHIFGAMVMPVVAGASTYAFGKVFIMHFESGGTFLDFSPEKVKKYYAEQFEKGKEFVSILKNKEEK